MKFERWVFAIAVVAIVAPALFAHIERIIVEHDQIPQLFAEIADDRRVQAMQLATAWFGEGENILFDSPHPLQMGIDDFEGIMLFCRLYHNEVELSFTGARPPSSVSAQRWLLGHPDGDFWYTGRYTIEDATGFVDGEAVTVSDNVIHTTNDQHAYLYEISAKWADCGSSSTYAFLLVHSHIDLPDELSAGSVMANFTDSFGWMVFYSAIPFAVTIALSSAGFIFLNALRKKGRKISQWAWLASSVPLVLFFSFFFAGIVVNLLVAADRNMLHLFGINIGWIAFVLITAILLCAANRLIAKRELS